MFFKKPALGAVPIALVKLSSIWVTLSIVGNSGLVAKDTIFLGGSGKAVWRAWVACLIASCSGRLTASAIDLASLLPSGA